MRLAYFLLIELTTAQRAKMTKLSRVAGFFSSSRKHKKVIEIGKKKQRAQKRAGKKALFCTMNKPIRALTR